MTRKLSIFYSSKKKHISGVRNENKFCVATNLWRGPLTQTSDRGKNTSCCPLSCEEGNYIVTMYALRHAGSLRRSQQAHVQMLCSVACPRACLFIYCKCNPTVERKIIFRNIIMFYFTRWCRVDNQACQNITCSFHVWNIPLNIYSHPYPQQLQHAGQIRKICFRSEVILTTCGKIFHYKRPWEYHVMWGRTPGMTWRLWNSPDVTKQPMTNAFRLYDHTHQSRATNHKIN